MKVFAYSYRKFDEAPYFEKYCKELGIELGYTEEDPTLENAHLAAGYPYISILLTRVDAALVEEFARLGVKMISNRLIGVDHVDVKRAKELGIRISNAPYSSNCVADYTLMLMLMSIRRMRQILRRNEMNDFTLPGIQGLEMANLTVGVLGTGKIGRTVIRDLHGFGSRVLAYDLYENDEVKQYATYVDLDTILRQSDMLTLHMPLTDENFHLLDREAFAKMKDGVVLINTARGPLVDTNALLDALESGKVGAAGLDVVEDEVGLYHHDWKNTVIHNRFIPLLRGFNNVILTSHKAYYTDQSVSDMVRNSLLGCYNAEHGLPNPFEV